MTYDKNTWQTGDTVTAEKLNSMEKGIEAADVSYTKQTWQTGDTVTADKLNHMEDGIEDAQKLIVAFTYDDQEDVYIPDKTLEEIDAAYNDGLPMALVSGGVPVFGAYDSEEQVFFYGFLTEENDYYLAFAYALTSNGVVTVAAGLPYYNTSGANVTAADVLSGVEFYGPNGWGEGTIPTKSASNMTVSGDTVSVPAGYYSSPASKAVASGSAGTPTASKGAVSNHAVTVTPSVTNTGGYIAGGTKTGTGVSVSASELVSGSETKTANGTYDVTNLAELIVNVAGGGSSGLEYEIGTWEPDSDVANAWVPLQKNHSTPPAFYLIWDATGDYDSSNSIIHHVMYMQSDRFGIPSDHVSTSSQRYGIAGYGYRSSASAFATSQIDITHAYSNTGTSGTSYPRYWAQESQIRCAAGSTSRKAKAGRTYAYIAIWAPTT